MQEPATGDIDKLEDALESVPQDELVRVYVTRDPKGKKSVLPTIPVDRSRPLSDQIWECLTVHAAEPGPFEFRLRSKSGHIASVLANFEFVPREQRAAPIAPTLVVPAATPAPGHDALETVRRYRELKRQMRELDEEDEDDEEEDDEEDEEIEEEDAEPAEAARESNPGSSWPALLMTFLGTEEAKAAVQGFVLQGGDNLASLSKKHAAEAERILAEAALMRREVEGKPSTQAAPSFSPRTVKAVVRLVPDPAPEAGHASGDDT